ncbi:MAG: Rpn family recombination-promoting nuclease/putative transposase [Spirochaetota bacterium]
MALPHNPYDAFFHEAFEDPHTARELTQFAAPEFASQYSHATISVKRDSLVPPELRSRQTDLLIRFGQNDQSAYAFVLYEHKSYPDRWVSVQLLRYLLIIWSREPKREHSGINYLPPIMPIVIYHGRKTWKQPREFSELVADMNRNHVPYFKPAFVNLATIEPDQITGSLRFVLALVSLKYVQQKLEEAEARRLVSLFDKGRRDPEVADLAQLAERLYVQTRSRDEIEHLTAIAAEAHYESTEEDLMTYAEELLKEGMAKGIRKGELQDKQNVLTRQLSRRFDLTASERELIAACEDPDALDAALDEIVVATEKGQVLSKLARK